MYVSSKGEKTLHTSFNRIANLSCINPDLIKELETPIRLGRPRQLYLIKEGRYIEIMESIVLDFYIDNVLLSDEFLLVPGLSDEVIIGDATLRKWRIKLDFGNDRVIVDPKVAELQLKVTEFNFFM